MAGKRTTMPRKPAGGNKGSAADSAAVARKGRKPVDPDETRPQKLERLAIARVTRACKYIQYCGNLASYRPNEAQRTKIMEALVKSCQAVEARLEGTRRESFTFSLN